MSIDVSTHLELSRGLLKALLQEAANLRKSATVAFPFLEYAVRNILYHADIVAGSGITKEIFI